MPDAGAGRKEQLPGPIPGRLPGGDQPQRAPEISPAEARGCRGKKKYLDRATAEAGLARSLAGWQKHRQKNRRDRKLGVYPCKFCSCWHVGHSDSPRRMA